jgi:uncharacterized OsmC-like protein
MATIAASLERLEGAVHQRPGFGVGTATARATLAEGLLCTVDDGHHVIDTDLAPAFGGGGAAPSPSTLLRAAFASCMAMSYRLRAERAGIELTSITVTVETDSAIAGMLLADAEVPPGFTDVRFHVEVDSDAPEHEVLALLDEGDRLSPVLDTISRAHVVARTATIRTTTSRTSTPATEAS